MRTHSVFAVERLRAEQRAAVAHLSAHPGDRYTELWISDLFLEEILIEAEETQAEKAFNSKALASDLSTVQSSDC